MPVDHIPDCTCERCWPHNFYAVWGNGSLGTEAGILSGWPTKQEAQRAVDAFLSRNDNPAVGAWVRPSDDDAPLRRGESYGLGGDIQPPTTVVREKDGRYYLDRLTPDLKGRREEITAEQAADWIASQE